MVQTSVDLCDTRSGESATQATQPGWGTRCRCGHIAAAHGPANGWNLRGACLRGCGVHAGGGGVVTADTWAQGYTTGQTRGRHDRRAEHDDTYTRNPQHRGHPDEPPALDDGQRETWVDGFLTGYSHAAVAP